MLRTMFNFISRARSRIVLPFRFLVIDILWECDKTRTSRFKFGSSNIKRTVYLVDITVSLIDLFYIAVQIKAFYLSII